MQTLFPKGSNTIGKRCDLHNLQKLENNNLFREEVKPDQLKKPLSEIVGESSELSLELYFLTGDEPADFDPNTMKKEDFNVIKPIFDKLEGKILQIAESWRITAEKPMRMDEFFDVPLWFEEKPLEIHRTEVPVLQSIINEQEKVVFLLHNVLSPQECQYQYNSFI